jgi:hypothetical protein
MRKECGSDDCLNADNRFSALRKHGTRYADLPPLKRNRNRLTMSRTVPLYAIGAAMTMGWMLHYAGWCSIRKSWGRTITHRTMIVTSGR